jgi:ParB family chromosome partitioning protein
VARRSGLGKGLGALIPAGERAEVSRPSGGFYQELPLSHVEPNPMQPRVYFDDAALEELASSIREVGVLQPVLVRQIAPDRYELIAGERRWRAARAAGLTTIPAIVRSADPGTSLEQALVENLHRQDLNPLEEAAAYQQLVDEFGLTQEEVARKVGRSRSAVANTIRLLQLPPAVQRLVADGRLSAGHARAILAAPDPGFQEEVARLAVEEELTVREVEELVRRQVDGDQGDESATKNAGTRSGAATEPGAVRPAAILELEDLLASLLDTRVNVQLGARRGRLTIDFANVEDLERIYRLIAGRSSPLQAG